MHFKGNSLQHVLAKIRWYHSLISDPCRYVHAAHAIGCSHASGTSGVIVSGTHFYFGDDGGAISLVGIFRRAQNNGGDSLSQLGSLYTESL